MPTSSTSRAPTSRSRRGSAGARTTRSSTSPATPRTRVYNWELFFHAPLYIAQLLSQNQQFEDAQTWFHYIFDPTRQGPDAGAAAVLDHQAAPRADAAGDPGGADQRPAAAREPGRRERGRAGHALAADPFNPFLLADLRPVAYMKRTVMSYLDNLIAWADNLFAQRLARGAERGDAALRDRGRDARPAAGRRSRRRATRTSVRRPRSRSSTRSPTRWSTSRTSSPAGGGGGGDGGAAAGSADLLLQDPAERQAARLLGRPSPTGCSSSATARTSRAWRASSPLFDAPIDPGAARAGAGGRRRHRQRAQRRRRAAPELPLHGALPAGARLRATRSAPTARRCWRRSRRATPTRSRRCSRPTSSSCSRTATRSSTGRCSRRRTRSTALEDNLSSATTSSPTTIDQRDNVINACGDYGLTMHARRAGAEPRRSPSGEARRSGRARCCPNCSLGAAGFGGTPGRARRRRRQEHRRRDGRRLERRPRRSPASLDKCADAGERRSASSSTAQDDWNGEGDPKPRTTSQQTDTQIAGAQLALQIAQQDQANHQDADRPAPASRSTS